MSAGTGVRHSEFNHSGENDVHFVQMWALPRSSGESGVDAPVRLRADATVRVAKLEDGALSFAFDPARYGFLFVADGAVQANGVQLGAGDAVRMHGSPNLELSGSGEVVLWDVPPTDVRLEDA